MILIKSVLVIVRESNGPASHDRSPLAFAITASAVAMSNLDLFVVNVALPSIGRYYSDSSLSSVSWVLNGYAIVFAALLVPFGRIADRIGHRLGFLLGTAAFTLASALCTVSPAVGWLVAARMVQAAGAALLVPTSLALLMAATPAARRPAVVRGWTAVAGAAAAIGPAAGGLLTEADWRWVFLINLPVGVTCLLSGMRILPRLGASAETRLPDMIGTVLLIIAVGALALGLVNADTWGWESAAFLSAMAIVVVAGALLVMRSSRHPSPLLEISLLRIRGFACATIAVTLFTTAFAMMLLSVVLWCQDVLGYSALITGLAVAPGPVMVPLLALAVGPLAKRVGGSAMVAALGILAFAMGLGLWVLLVNSVHSDYSTQLLPGMLLTGVGVGLALPALIGSAATVLPRNRFATGTAVIQMTRQIGSALGVAILITVLGSDSGLGAVVVRSYHSGWLTAIGACALAEVATLMLVLRSPRAGSAAIAKAPDPEAEPEGKR